MPPNRAVAGQSANRDGAADPLSPLADYYQWVEPDSGVRIYTNFGAAERLQIQVLRGRHFGGGVEVGGILLGRTEPGEGSLTVIVEDFEPLPCSYSNGPFYSPTGAGAARFEAALERHKSKPESGLSVIGYYRSHNRDNLYLSPADLTLIRRVFPGGDNVFLVIKPLSTRACTGGFFLWDYGKIQSEFTLELPFAPVRQPFPAPSGTDAIDDLLLPDRLDLTAVQPGRTRKLVVAALGLALSLGVFGYWQMKRSTAASPAPAAKVVATAGERHPPIPTIANSPVVETPPAVSPGNRPRPAAPAPAVQKPADRQPAVPPAASAATATAPDPKPEESASLPAEPLPGQTLPGQALSSQTLPSRTLPSQTLPSQTKVSELPVAPTVPAIPPPAAPRPVAPNAETVSPPPLLKISYVGPQITYRATPEVSRQANLLISDETQIDVTVQIDAAGWVTGAQVTSRRGIAAGLIVLETLKAARLFRFQPARENGRAVPSESVLSFRFRPRE